MSFINLVNTEVEINGYTFSPLTLTDLGSFVLYFKYFPLEEAKIATVNLPVELRKEILREVYDKCKCRTVTLTETNPETKEVTEREVPITFDNPVVSQFAASFHGIVYQFYLSIKHKHPEITLHEAQELATPEIVNEVQEKIFAELTSEIKEEMDKRQLGELIPSIDFGSL